MFGLDTISAENIQAFEAVPKFLDHSFPDEPQAIIMIPEYSYETSKEVLSGVHLPKYDNIVRNSGLWDQKSSIIIPHETFGVKKTKEGTYFSMLKTK